MTRRFWLFASMGLAVVLIAGTRVHRAKTPVDECCAGKDAAAAHKDGDCPMHKGDQALPPGHPDMNGARVAAPPLDEMALAQGAQSLPPGHPDINGGRPVSDKKNLVKGKASECPYLMSQPSKAAGETGTGDLPVVKWMTDQKVGGKQ